MVFSILHWIDQAHNEMPFCRRFAEITYYNLCIVLVKCRLAQHDDTCIIHVLSFMSSQMVKFIQVLFKIDFQIPLMCCGVAYFIAMEEQFR